ncbi:MAG: hypothetical protein WCT33_03900 [Patescibacteria group bacterium]
MEKNKPIDIYKLFVDANKNNVALYKKVMDNPRCEFLFDLAIDIAASKADLLHSLTPGIKAKEKFKEYSKGNYWKNELESANRIIKKYFLENDKALLMASENAFHQIILLVNRKNVDSKQQIAEAVMLLENLIDTYLPILNEWLSYYRELPDTNKLRKEDNNRSYQNNTVCRLCWNPLKRFNNHNYCSRRENRSCAEKHLQKKERKYERFKEPEFIEQCDVCTVKFPGALVTRHFHNREWMRFCSEACYETIRKREQRKRKSG